ncbi:MAG: glutamate synthase (NADPH/NADH) small chain [Saprospiraceae bacterium]|jgi:glutamate synthase (NADPH/NADH) small chain
MGKPTGFIETPRKERGYKPVEERLKHFKEFVVNLSDEQVSAQGARCMDCGIPYCHTGCPVDNQIPDWNDLVYTGQWREALDQLHSTNNFPEFTGRICPAPCEQSCTLNITNEPVTIKTIEQAIIEKGWKNDWVEPRIAKHRTGKRVAIIGSGPSGLACAQQLARAGHQVDVYEKQARIGGLLRYGIPDFKLDKAVIDRRMSQMRREGVHFHTNTHVGVDLPVWKLWRKFDAIVLAGGAEKARDLPILGRELNGVHFAMDFLRRNTAWVQGDDNAEAEVISAEGKHVLVIGGGDTGSDCIGTSGRHGAASITQIEIMPQPPEQEDKGLVWPDWPNKMRTSSSQEEGCERMWSVLTKRFVGDDNGNLTHVECVKVQWQQDDKGQWQMSEVAGSEFEIKADLVTLAMGFVHPVQHGMLKEMDVNFDARGNVAANTEGELAYHSSVEGVFATGDTRRGQSLVVWAIREGRQAARSVDVYLMGDSQLPR